MRPVYDLLAPKSSRLINHSRSRKAGFIAELWNKRVDPIQQKKNKRKLTTQREKPIPKAGDLWSQLVRNKILIAEFQQNHFTFAANTLTTTGLNVGRYAGNLPSSTLLVDTPPTSNVIHTLSVDPKINVHMERKRCSDNNSNFVSIYLNFITKLIGTEMLQF